ncbi:sulfurtransferase [Candidatus Methylacidithermus pantelleriae]|uniref:Thiosulfate sulfurtransferase n=1 Tax=Candidatus Methylacidithermus pantelleriae TaxID=2744239 RepID=A0A8J2BN18_9BACT|nr:sulfurtransferase [Candidatus Methylacidithermus pantelleriae]CAF0697784.1 Thiosulfate sulfurtransferase [Candidatus Methylacidithermus pantelleriae]
MLEFPAPAPDLIVSPEELLARLGDSSLVVLDVRGEVVHVTDTEGKPATRYHPLPEEYERGHIPGALFVDFTLDIVNEEEPIPLQLAPAEKFARTMSQLGVDEEKWVVVYDADGSYLATRLWWALTSYGHPHVSVLEEGFAGWIRRGYPVRHGVESPSPSRWTVSREASSRLELPAVWSMMQEKGGIILDARSPDRYGQGHIPGAKNLPFFELKDPVTGKFLDPPRVIERLRKAGIPEDRATPIVCSCGSGHSATLVFLQLYRLGYRNLWVYDGSWNEWSRSGLPQEKEIETC